MYIYINYYQSKKEIKKITVVNIIDINLIFQYFYYIIWNIYFSMGTHIFYNLNVSETSKYVMQHNVNT